MTDVYANEESIFRKQEDRVYTTSYNSDSGETEVETTTVTCDEYLEGEKKLDKIDDSIEDFLE